MSPAGFNSSALLGIHGSKQSIFDSHEQSTAMTMTASGGAASMYVQYLPDVHRLSLRVPPTQHWIATDRIKLSVVVLDNEISGRRLKLECRRMEASAKFDLTKSRWAVDGYTTYSIRGGMLISRNSLSTCTVLRLSKVKDGRCSNHF